MRHSADKLVGFIRVFVAEQLVPTTAFVFDVGRSTEGPAGPGDDEHSEVCVCGYVFKGMVDFGEHLFIESV